MSLSERLQRFIRQGVDTVRAFPAESLLSVFFFGYSLLLIAEKTSNTDFLALFPLFFSAFFLLNRWSPHKPFRWIYYVAPLSVIPCLWIDLQEWVLSVSYVIALVLCPLMIAVCRWRLDNRAFVIDALHYLKNLIAATLLSGVAFLLIIAIYFSLDYIFPSLPLGDDEKFVLTVCAACFLWLLPIVFLTFVRLQQDEYTSHPFLDILTNYVITPALLIYTLILYVYFLSILFQASLPRGGIAYLVFIFTLIAVGVKAYQPLQGKRLYDWFFNRFQWISLPALLMFWIGTGYRIHQYGYTQPRIYLVLCGVIMTLTVLMFFSRKWGRYLYVTSLSVVLLAVFTYLPGLTARELGIRAQRARLADVVEELNLPSVNGRLQQNTDTLRVDSLTGLRYEALYASFEYLYYAHDTTYLQQHYGYSSFVELNEAVMPANVFSGQYDAATEEMSVQCSLTYLSGFDVSGFKQFHPVCYYDRGEGYYYETRQDSLFLYTSGQHLLCRISYADLYDAQLQKTGLTPEELTQETLDKYREAWMTYDNGGYRLILNDLFFENSPLQIQSLSVYGLLTRE